jgi:hypothetical protein
MEAISSKFEAASKLRVSNLFAVISLNLRRDRTASISFYSKIHGSKTLSIAIDIR